MYIWDKILKDVASAASKAAGVKVSSHDFVAPPNPNMGDLAFGCFRLAKTKKKNPAEIAKDIASEIKPNKIIEKAEAAGPYVNVTLKIGALADLAIKDVEKHGEKFGRRAKSEGQRANELMLEYAQPNTHKEVHIGHLRNFFIGSALINLLESQGWKVVPTSYHGDVGAHVSKCLWFMVRKAKVKDFTNKTAEALLKKVPAEDRNSRYLGALYSGASKLLHEKPDLKDEVSEVQNKLEAKDPAWTKLWNETRKWSLAEMKSIFKELGVKVERQYLESEVQDPGQKIVDQLLKKKIAKKSKGAIIVDLEKKKLGVFLIRKSDGTSLYATKDLALAQLKLKEYPKVKRSLLVIDNRQDFYFQQLFEVLKQMGFKHTMEFVGYEFVTLKSGAMASREGNVVTWQDFRDEVLKFATKETKTRHKDWSKKKIEQTAWDLMMGGIKFNMLKQDGDKAIVFDIKQAVSFDGDTGPYVQYAATRLGSILRKAAWKGGTGGSLSELDQLSEKRLALTMAQFPNVVRAAAEESRPSLIARWCVEMATRSNEFYRDVKVLESEPGLKKARLRLVASARQALILGLGLLGIPTPEEM
ncbi:MAG: arginine--tRNA ligase [Patescibacteria group bacterium]|nr:arginine--tRNA ligase [Patescibacteria group bacterium]